MRAFLINIYLKPDDVRHPLNSIINREEAYLYKQVDFLPIDTEYDLLLCCKDKHFPSPNQQPLLHYHLVEGMLLVLLF